MKALGASGGRSLILRPSPPLLVGDDTFGSPALLQHHSLKASIFWHSSFFMVQLSHPYMILEKKNSFDYTDLCRQNDVSAFNTLSRLVIVFLPRSKHLLIFMAAVAICSDFGAQKNNV